jgi:hypothetical protein
MPVKSPQSFNRSAHFKSFKLGAVTRRNCRYLTEFSSALTRGVIVFRGVIVIVVVIGQLP